MGIFSTAFLISHNAAANTIGDFVWDDLNTNGVQDAFEPGIPNLSVRLFDPASNFVAATATDPNGYYEFTNVVNGSYFMRFTPLPSFPYYITTNDAGIDDNLDSDINAAGDTPIFNYTGVAVTNIDAGYVQYVADIEILKLASDGVYTAPEGTDLFVTNGRTVTYTYLITNSGNAYLSNILFIDDPHFPLGPDGLFTPIISCPNNLAPGETFLFTTQLVINASVTNVGTVVAFPVNFKTCDFLALDPVQDTNNAVVIVVDPGFDLTKERVAPTNRAAAVGESVEFRLSVVNTGDQAFPTVPLEDTYDTNYLAYVSSSVASDDNVNDGVINWANVGPLSVGGTLTITTRFTAVASTPATETNTVIAAPLTPTNSPPVDPQTNTAPYDVVNPSVSIVKTLVSPTNRPAALGETNVFEIVIQNTGDITLDTVPVDDVYPPALLNFDSAVPVPDSVLPLGTLSWTNVGPLIPLQSTTVTVSFTAIASGSDINFVQTTPTTTNGIPVPPDDDPEGFTNVNPGVAITKTLIVPTNRPSAVGETNYFSITVTNIGDVTLDVVPVIDTYDPALINFVDSVPTPDAFGPNGFEWFNLGPLAPGAFVTVTARFEAVGSGIGTNFVSTAPTTTNGIPVPPDEDPEGYTNVNPSVLITKVLVNPTNRPAALGETNFFRITILNNGDIPLDTVPLNDTYNTSLLGYIGADPASDDNTDDGSIDWTDLTGVGSLAVNDSIIITTRFVAVGSGSGINLALTEPTTTNDIPVPPDEDPEGFTNVNPVVEITKTLVSPVNRPAALNEVLIFSIVVTNAGDVTLDTVPVEDNYDTALLTYQFANPAPDDPTNDGTLNWADVGPLAPGAFTTITAQFFAAASGIGTNDVLTAPTTTNGIPVPPDDDPEGFTNVNPSVSITKTLISPANRPAALGETNVFTILVENTGDIALDTVPVEDTFDPALLTVLSSTPPPNGIGPGILTWTNVGPLSVGGSTIITTRFVAAASGIGTNFVRTAPTTTNDIPVPPDEDPEGFTNVNPSVSIVKTLISPTNRPAIVGETNVFIITISNTGDITLDTVPVGDQYGTNLVEQAFITPPADAGGPEGFIWTNLGPLAVGQSITVTTGLRAVSAGIGTNFSFTEPTTTNGVPVPPDDDPEGYTNITITIGDTVWIDLNNNGIPDDDLNAWGLNGITVVLSNTLNSAVTTTVTGPGVGQQGFYEFTNLPYGVYVVSVDLTTVPALLAVQTTPNSYTIDPDAPGFPADGIIDDADFGFQSGSLTPIELSSFTAHRIDGGIQVDWETAVEIDSLGFNIYRASTAYEHARVKLTASLIPSVGGEDGAVYTFTDAYAREGIDYLYWLEEVAVNGDTELFGPVVVRDGESDEAKLATASLGSGGLIRIDYDALLAAGVSVNEIDLTKLQVFIDDTPVASYVSTEEGLLQSGDYILFYAPPADDEREVILTNGEESDVMDWLYARPARSGNLGVVEVGEEGSAAFDIDTSASRMMVSGFTNPMIWVLDITDPDQPALLYGQVVVQGDQSGAYAVYFSVNPEVTTRGIAVQDDQVIDLNDIRSE